MRELYFPVRTEASPLRGASFRINFLVLNRNSHIVVFCLALLPFFSVYLCVAAVVCFCVENCCGCVYLSRNCRYRLLVTNGRKPPSTARINEERDRARQSRRAWGAILKTRRRCHVCQISFSSEVNGIAHFRGKAHARQLDFNNGPYTCGPCGVSFPRKNEHSQHLYSKAHIRKQLEIEQNKNNQE